MANPQFLPIPSRVKDLTGETFGRLTVTGFIGMHREANGHGRPRFMCLCVCGNSHSALSASLRGGMVKSCGCLARENGRAIGLASRGSKRPGQGARHSMSRTPEHNAWSGIKQRCFNPNVRNYSDYGGRGITMCDRWRDSFEAFLSDMGPRPTASHSLDRVDNDGDYEPGNVRWATASEQMNNKRDNHRVSYNGRSISLSDAERLSGISQKVLWYRINAGWPEGRLFLPVGQSTSGRAGHEI